MQLLMSDNILQKTIDALTHELFLPMSNYIPQKTIDALTHE